VAADVVDLMKHRRPVRMALIDDPLEMRNNVVALSEKVASDKYTRSMGRCRFDNNHSGATAGAFSVIPKVPVAGQPFVTHIHRVRSEDHPILQRPVTDLDRREN
jgi:hypothetical protein